ncbi:MAG: hypothetical protein KF715_09405 [Candidatus Didemnitutus sp.]|nr:hypothetical protein [Candidatus Didemnitutus sp.]
MLKLVLRDKLVWLLLGLGAAMLGIGRWVLPIDQALLIVSRGGYWLMLGNVVLFGWALWRLSKSLLLDWKPARADFGAAALILGCCVMWAAHERHGFKILADEELLLGTSMGIHYDREIGYPARASDVTGPLQLNLKVLDKRPYFFPFVVATVHDLTGYRPGNAFWVNTALGAVFLSLVYVLGWQLARSRWAGALLVLLFAGLPLAAQQSAGGGFELLNLVMISTLLLLARRYARAPDEAALDALCLGAVLLAFTRYESVLFIVPVGTLVLWGWWRAGRVVLTWPVVLTPVFLFPYVLQNRVFAANPATWELGSIKGADQVFALHYVPDNLGHALAFFFDRSGYQANSIYFAALGLAALPFLLLLVVRTLRQSRDATTDSADVGSAFVVLGLFGLAALLMTYFWGQFDHPVIRRLSLPVHLLLGLAIVVVGASFLRTARGWQLAIAGAVAALVFQGLPMMAQRAYEWDYTPGVEMAWRDEFLKKFPARDYLFIDQDSTFWITQRMPATPIKQAGERKEGLAYHLRNHSFSAMYVFQRFTVNDQTGALTIDPADDIGPDFELEPVMQKRVATLHLARISRITAIHDKGAIVARAGLAPAANGPALTGEELEKAKAQYLEKWIRQLP